MLDKRLSAHRFSGRRLARSGDILPPHLRRKRLAAIPRSSVRFPRLASDSVSRARSDARTCPKRRARARPKRFDRGKVFEPWSKFRRGGPMRELSGFRRSAARRLKRRVTRPSSCGKLLRLWGKRGRSAGQFAFRTRSLGATAGLGRFRGSGAARSPSCQARPGSFARGVAAQAYRRYRANPRWPFPSGRLHLHLRATGPAISGAV